MDDFKEVLKLLELGEYKLDEERKLTITDNEFANICRDLDEMDWRILDHVKRKGASAPVLEKEIKLSETSIKTHFGKLKGHELIETKPGVGAKITPRGVVFMRLVQIKGKEISERKPEGQQKLDSHNRCGCGGSATIIKGGVPLCDRCAENYMGDL